MGALPIRAPAHGGVPAGLAKEQVRREWRRIRMALTQIRGAYGLTLALGRRTLTNLSISSSVSERGTRQAGQSTMLARGVLILQSVAVVVVTPVGPVDRLRTIQMVSKSKCMWLKQVYLASVARPAGASTASVIVTPTLIVFRGQRVTKT